MGAGSKCMCILVDRGLLDFAVKTSCSVLHSMNILSLIVMIKECVFVHFILSILSSFMNLYEFINALPKSDYPDFSSKLHV